MGRKMSCKKAKLIPTKHEITVLCLYDLYK